MQDRSIASGADFRAPARWHGADRSTCEQAFVGRPKLRDRGARWSVEGHWRIHLALGREPEGAEASLMSAPVPADLSGVSWTWGDRMIRPRRDPRASRLALTTSAAT